MMKVKNETTLRPIVSPESDCTMLTSVAREAQSAPDELSGMSCHPISWRTSAL